jgi:hypothetical protein
VVVGYGWGGEEEAVPVKGGERRRLSGVRSRAEEVAGGARRRRTGCMTASGAGGRRRGRWAGPSRLGWCRLGGN